MIEIVLLVLAWYAIGLLSMLCIQRFIDKCHTGEREAWPGTSPHGDVGAQEVWVLGVCGPIVLCVIAYFVIVMWLITRHD